MSEYRIAARVKDADALAGVKAAAATYRARLIHWTDALNNLNLQDADLVVLEAANSNSAVDEFNFAREACPKADIVVLAAATTSMEQVRRLFRAGARDVLNLPIAPDQLLTALGEALGPGQTGESNGMVLGVVKAAGGVGATTIATNLAGYFANPPHGKRGAQMPMTKVAIIDFDIQLGSVALAMDVSPRKDLSEILRTPKRLDAHFLDGVMEHHRSGVRVLAAPSALTPLDAIDSEVAMAIANAAASIFDIVIIEMPNAIVDWTGDLMRRSDHLFLVSTAAVRGISGARRILDAAAQLNVDPSHWSLVFNRMNSALEGSDIIAQSRRALKLPVAGVLSEDSAVRDAGDRGRLIWETSPKGRFAKDMLPLCVEAMRVGEARDRANAQLISTR